MLQMTWDSKIAIKAQQWANNLNYDHDTKEDRDTGRGYTGQNIAKRRNKDPNPDWNEVIQSFYNEVSKFNQDTIDKYAFDKETGRFTQVIWVNSNKIGCGYVRYVKFNDFFHLYFCNYLQGGNIQDASVYEKGKPCNEFISGETTYPGLCQNE